MSESEETARRILSEYLEKKLNEELRLYKSCGLADAEVEIMRKKGNTPLNNYDVKIYDVGQVIVTEYS